MRTGWLAALICSCLFLTGSGLQAREFTVLFTSSANGVIENCYCPNVRLGGLEKRAQFIATYRQRDPDVLVMDNGDNFVEYLNSGFDKVIVAAFSLMKYDVINIGDQEVAYATEEYLGLPALVKIPGEPVTVTKGAVTFSVLPVLHPRTTRYYPDFVFEHLDLENTHSQIEKWLQSKTAGGTFRILLSHSGYEVDREFAASYPEIDLIIGGHSQTVLDSVVVVNGVPIVQAGGYASYVGEIRFEAGEDGFRVIESHLHPLPPEAPDHPEVMKYIDQYTTSP
ncbi:MAG: hypothetical protein JSU77_13770 [Fidelibacterota bacterium]|nr:MAG: hypothetical protein JSU77_13770 [Candidatus Neomarinimicrobiota bacterium]